MKALVFKDYGNLKLEEREKPTIQHPKDAIIKVTLASICSSDLHIKHGAVPRALKDTVLGHEFVGIVESIGSDVKKFKPGDRVAVSVETFCGECFFCKRGFVNNCSLEKGGWALGCRIDGGQAEYTRVPYADTGLTKLPDEVSDEDSILVGDVLSTGYWAAEIADIKEGYSIAIIGAGPTGACTMMCSRLFKPREIIAIDSDSERLELALKKGWADKTILAEENVEEKILDLTEHGCDVVFEVAGAKNTFEQSWKITRPSGTVVVVALYDEDQVLPLPDMYGKNLTFKTGGVHASSCEKIVDLIRQGKINTRPLITHEFSLEDIEKAYRVFEEKQDGVIKVMIRP